VIVILRPDLEENSVEFQQTLSFLSHISGLEVRLHQVRGAEQTLTEIYLIGNTARLSSDEIQELPGVERVIRISEEYRILGRHKDDNRATGFEHNGVTFSPDNLNVFAGLCAVDSRESVEAMMKVLKSHGQVCTRMGAYKPRSSPYAFQGFGKSCLSYTFELAGKYGIRVIAMEITHESHLDEIAQSLEETGHSTGVLIQIGTRNIQNFELLKRGFGITLNESLNAAEYLASEGNSRVIFCLRGMKTHLGDPHRNFVDFAHVSVLKRLTRMPVGIDPSHSVGSRDRSPDGILDIMHVTAQGVIAGANLVLVDFHPEPGRALVDGPQALRLEELEWFLSDVRLARSAYESRAALAKRPRS
jgi:3-deoxy-7-phosphoheptulonate synthase